MTYFVLLSSSQRRELFSKIKEKIDSWEKFYPHYNISRTMFFNYLSGRYNLSLRLFNIWKKISEFRGEVRVIEKRKYIKKEIKEIVLEEDLAEIIGVLNGDGHISKDKKEICIVGNKHEKDYALYLKKLFSTKLHIDFNLFFYGNCFKLRAYSIELSKFLIMNYNLPNGNKLGKLHIPRKIFVNRNLLTSYIRGLFDTDGTLYNRRKDDYVIEISSADKNYLIEIKSALESLNFKVSLLKNHVAIYKQDEIVKFFGLIKPANSKHLKKYQNFINQSASDLTV